MSPNIRNFVISSALTLVIDLGFTFVFLAVMFYYSPFVVGSFLFYVAISAGVTPILRQRLDKRDRALACTAVYRRSSIRRCFKRLA